MVKRLVHVIVSMAAHSKFSREASHLEEKVEEFFIAFLTILPRYAGAIKQIRQGMGVKRGRRRRRTKEEEHVRRMFHHEISQACCSDMAKALTMCLFRSHRSRDPVVDFICGVCEQWVDQFWNQKSTAAVASVPPQSKQRPTTKVGWRLL